MVLGQNSADERLAHLLCEVFIRLRCVGLTDSNSCVLLTTQADLDALMQVGMFNPNYLHLDRVGRHLDANAYKVLPAQF